MITYSSPSVSISYQLILKNVIEYEVIMHGDISTCLSALNINIVIQVRNTNCVTFLQKAIISNYQNM